MVEPLSLLQSGSRKSGEKAQSQLQVLIPTVYGP